MRQSKRTYPQQVIVDTEKLPTKRSETIKAKWEAKPREVHKAELPVGKTLKTMMGEGHI